MTIIASGTINHKSGVEVVIDLESSAVQARTLLSNPVFKHLLGQYRRAGETIEGRTLTVEEAYIKQRSPATIRLLIDYTLPSGADSLTPPHPLAVARWIHRHTVAALTDSRVNFTSEEDERGYPSVTIGGCIPVSIYNSNVVNIMFTKWMIPEAHRDPLVKSLQCVSYRWKNHHPNLGHGLRVIGATYHTTKDTLILSIKYGPIQATQPPAGNVALYTIGTSIVELMRQRCVKDSAPGYSWEFNPARSALILHWSPSDS